MIITDLIGGGTSAEYWDPQWCKPLCFTANTAGSTVALHKVGEPPWVGQYSRDKINWIDYVPSTTGNITLSGVGDKVYFRGNITGDFSDDPYLNFSMTGSIAASGNINSMYTAAGFESLKALEYACCYVALFANCTSLTTAPELPATILSDYCYWAMFEGCTSLTTAPALPATTLAEFCYYEMFYGCTSLQVWDASGSGHDKAWKIPTSGTFANTYSRANMFAYCPGTRSSDHMPGQSGQSYTYYTQNTPVS